MCHNEPLYLNFFYKTLEYAQSAINQNIDLLLLGNCYSFYSSKILLCLFGRLRRFWLYEIFNKVSLLSGICFLIFSFWILLLCFGCEALHLHVL